jgi:hypothetical protein
MGSGETNGSLGLDDKLILDLQLSLLAEGAHGTRRRTAKIDAEMSILVGRVSATIFSSESDSE